MNIWKILGIEPTVDKKVIKKAYAAKTRETHPEEKPEEFKQLHEAYQMALGYADYMSKKGQPDNSAAKSDVKNADGDDAGCTGGQSGETGAPDETTEQHGNVLSYFEENQERREQRVDAFLKHWGELRNLYENPEILDWWKQYLSSEEFQDIRCQPQVLYVLAKELDKKFFYKMNDLKILFWDAYGFHEDQENAYQGDMQQIWKSLYPAYKRRRQTLQNEQKRQSEQKLLSSFEENQQRHERRIDVFVKYWNEMQSPYRDPQVLDRWKTYLASEEFQEIRFHAKVLSLLVEEIDDKFLYGINDIKILFWDAYGFREGEETVYQGNLQRLYRSLYPAFQKRQQTISDKEKREKRNRIIRVFTGIAAAAVLAGCVLLLVRNHRQGENGRLFLMDYMAEQYPMADFSEPERLEEDEDGNTVYTMYAAAHPELSVTATVEYRYVEGKKTCCVTEDYKQQLFAYYAAQYGLEAGLAPYTAETNALFYRDIKDLDAFCEKAEKMFQEQEELQMLSEVAFLPKPVLFSLVQFDGGVWGFYFADKQVYDPRNMKAEELSTALREAYMSYMFQYEPWNITTEQYREWGAAYEKICEKWENDDGEWHEVYDPETGEYLCRLFISTYERIDGSYNIDRISVPRHVRMITVGNAYYFLQDRGADLIVNEDGSGFSVMFYGRAIDFGLYPEVKFDDLRDCY